MSSSTAGRWRRAPAAEGRRNVQRLTSKVQRSGNLGCWAFSVERSDRAAGGYDGFYPSLHLTYHVRETLLARLAYAQTYGRPDFSNIVPNATISEADLDADTADPSLVRGRIDVRNTGLKPWTGHNYDLSLEYYTQQGGLVSAGAFLKEIQEKKKFSMTPNKL